VQAGLCGFEISAEALNDRDGVRRDGVKAGEESNDEHQGDEDAEDEFRVDANLRRTGKGRESSHEAGG
jgi:hypothetical protein